MTPTGQRIIAASKAHGVKLRTLCTIADLQYPTIRRAIKEGRDLPFTAVEAISTALDLPLAYFSERRASVNILGVDGTDEKAMRTLKEVDLTAIEAGSLIDTDSVLDWLDLEKGILRNYDFLRDNIDLFHPAQEGDTTLKPAQIGNHSLARIFFDLNSLSDYDAKFKQLSRKTQRETVENHIAVQTLKQYRVEPVEIKASLDGVQIEGKYRRIMAPVTNEQGQAFTLVFARLTHAFRPSVHVDSHPDGNPQSSVN